MNLSERMIWLARRGCYPCTSRRGDLWRAHVNQCGDWWEDAPTPHLALEKATKNWVEGGCPMDGIAELEGGDL